MTEPTSTVVPEQAGLPAAVLWDMDGTLVDSQATILGAMTAAFAAVDAPAPSRAEILSIVGESGSGTSVTLMSLLGLNDPKTTFVEGAVAFRGRHLLEIQAKYTRQKRYRAEGRCDHGRRRAPLLGHVTFQIIVSLLVFTTRHQLDPAG